MIISTGYVGQLFGAVVFGSLAEKIGRLKTLFITIVLFVSMDVACLFAWSVASMMALRFLQGVGTGGEVPVASAYINEFIGAEKRGRFFLLYEVIFPIGLMFAGMAGFFLVPVFGWKAMFIVGLIPSVLTIPLRWLMPKSPRWLASKGRITEANAVVKLLEDSATRRGVVLREPSVRPIVSTATARSDSSCIRRVYAQSAPASVVRGSERDLRSDQSWSAGSLPTWVSGTFSRHSQRSHWLVGSL